MGIKAFLQQAAFTMLSLTLMSSMEYVLNAGGWHWRRSYGLCFPVCAWKTAKVDPPRSITFQAGSWAQGTGWGGWQLQCGACPLVGCPTLASVRLL